MCQGNKLVDDKRAAVSSFFIIISDHTSADKKCKMDFWGRMDIAFVWINTSAASANRFTHKLTDVYAHTKKLNQTLVRTWRELNKC